MTTGHVVVTGGAGFIGSVLAAHLATQGDPACIVDDLASASVANLAGIPLADYWDKQWFLRRINADADLPRLRAIIHLGACSSTLEFDAAFLMRNNFAYTRALAQWCLRRGVRLIYASSAATYGDGAQGYRADLALLPSLVPRNAYAYSKHAFDLWALRHGAFAGAGAITGLKYFNVFGPNEYHKGAMRSMVLQAHEQIRATGQVRLFQSGRPEFADGDQERDFIYVRDAMAMTAWFLEHPEATGIYNVGSGTVRTWNDLARAVFTAMLREPHIEYIAMPEAMRAAYQYSTCADLTSLRAAGCQVAVRSLEEGVREYVQDFLSGAVPYLRQ